MNYTGKKLLVLGSASVHIKLIKAAQQMGVYTIVTDNIPYEESLGKQIADEYWDINIYDVDEIVSKAKKTGIEGVIAGWLDPCQRPYCQICNKLGLPCYGTEEQFFKMTDKHAFKKMCIESGVDVIPEYTEQDVADKKVIFPVFVKPVDSRGSRGQMLCENYDDLDKAIVYAKSESSTGDVLIEKYINGAQEFQVTYYFVDGNPYLIRTVDSYCGSEKNQLQKVVACAISPSRYTNTYIEKSNDKVVNMFKKLGITNGPIFMQGFVDGEVFRFFDPGLRFPGVDYELIYKKVFGIDLMQKVIEIALGRKDFDLDLPQDGVFLNGYRAAVLFPTIKAGTIKRIDGIKQIEDMDCVTSFWLRSNVGEKIEWAYNINQRLAEIDIVSKNTEELKENIKTVQETLKPYDIEYNDMRFEIFDITKIR